MGYEQTFSLVCPSETTCYADSVGGQLEYTHDGGSAWQQAAGTGTATSLPQISEDAALTGARGPPRAQTRTFNGLVPLQATFALIGHPG